MFTLLELQRATHIANEMRKASRGHLFTKSLKERCIFCGEDRKTRTDCASWFQTFLDRMQTILINPEFYKDDDIEGYFYQHGDEYGGIKLVALEKPKGKDGTKKA